MRSYFKPVRLANISLVLLFSLGIFKIFAACNYNLKTCDPKKFDSAQIAVFEKYDLVHKIRSNSINLAHKHLPSPHSELLLGMTIGIDQFNKLPLFSEMLRKTGTIHVVVVSGFNINLVFNYLVRLLGNKYKSRNFVLASMGTLFYAALSGMDPPVVRAWIMGIMISYSKFHGRKVSIYRVLLLSAGLLIFLVPAYIFSLSFQLSFLATLGLIVAANFFQNIFSKLLPGGILAEDFSATVAAQLFVWPLISYTFGTFSLCSFIVNGIILWTVPMATIFGGIFLIFGSFHHVFATLLGLLIYFPLEIFVLVIEAFSRFKYGVFNIEISGFFMVCYYLFLGLAALYFSKKTYK